MFLNSLRVGKSISVREPTPARSRLFRRLSFGYPEHHANTITLSKVSQPGRSQSVEDPLFSRAKPSAAHSQILSALT